MEIWIPGLPYQKSLVSIFRFKTCAMGQEFLAGKEGLANKNKTLEKENTSLRDRVTFKLKMLPGLVSHGLGQLFGFFGGQLGPCLADYL